MSTDDYVLLGTLGPFVTFVVLFVIDVVTEDARECALWPRGLRWFPGVWDGMKDAAHRAVLRIFWPEKAHRFKPYRLLVLEALDRDWRTWARTSDGGIPEWMPMQGRTGGRWAPRCAPKSLCPCGYGEECAVWCGAGHSNGSCDLHPSKPGVRYER